MTNPLEVLGMLIMLPASLVFTAVAFGFVFGTLYAALYITLKLMGKEMPVLPLPSFKRRTRPVRTVVRPETIPFHSAAPYASRNLIILPKEKR